MLNRETFFDVVRDRFSDNSGLSQRQVEGFDFLLAFWDNWNGRQLNAGSGLHVIPEAFAYILATVWHETARTMQPIKEKGGDAYFKRMYDKAGDRPRVAARLGNIRFGDGVKYPGRGYPQLTGRSNYKKASKITGVDLIENPERMLEPLIAAEVMFDGMMNGWFTGVGLPDFIGVNGADYVRARKVVNALDRASLIAEYAKEFYKALVAAQDAWEKENNVRLNPESVEPMPLREHVSDLQEAITKALEANEPVVFLPEETDEIDKQKVTNEFALDRAADLVEKDKDIVIETVARKTNLPTWLVRFVLKRGLPFLLDFLRGN